MRRILQLVAAYAGGEDRTLTPFSGQGFLRTSFIEVSPRTKGITGATGNRWGMERNGKESPFYHECHHAQ